jgi:phytol kinase
MITQIAFIAILILFFLGVIQFTEMLYHRFHVNAEITRKIAHIASTLTSLSFIYLFDSHWYLLFLACILFLLLYISKREGLFKSIESIDRKSSGSYILPVSIYLLFLIFELTNNQLLFILPILLLGISDPLAGISGMNLTKNPRKIRFWGYVLQKTYVGSFTFFLTSFILIVMALFFHNYPGYNILISGLFFAGSITIVEMLSSKGTDNFTVPLTTVILLWI